MKLLYCGTCNSMFSLSIGKIKSCDCGRVKGRYINNRHAEVNGKGVSVAIGNGSFVKANYELAESGKGEDRKYYQNNCQVKYCWVRPHEGMGNPNIRINKDL